MNCIDFSETDRFYSSLVWMFIFALCLTLTYSQNILLLDRNAFGYRGDVYYDRIRIWVFYSSINYCPKKFCNGVHRWRETLAAKIICWNTWRKWTHFKRKAVLGESKARDWISWPVFPDNGLYTIWTEWFRQHSHSHEEPCSSEKLHRFTMWIIAKHQEEDIFSFSYLT